jgi:hypothetical protein
VESLINLHGRPKRKKTKARQPQECLLLCLGEVYKGIGFVQKAQIQTIEDLGYRPVVVFLPWPGCTEADSLALESKIRREFFKLPGYIGNSRKATFRMLHPGKSFESLRTLNLIASGDCELHDLRTYATYCKGLRLPPFILEKIREEHFEAIYCNYIFFADLLTRYPEIDRNKVRIELHDCQALQNILRRGYDQLRKDNEESLWKRVDASEQAFEQQEINQFSHISCVDPTIEKTLSLKKQAVVLRPYQEISADTIALAKDEALLKRRFIELLDKSSLDAEQREHCKKNGIDLIYIGSEHEANVISMEWFMDEVFYPYLSAFGVELYLAGAICQRFDVIKGVQLLGFVDDPVVAQIAAKVVALPTVIGTGMPTKVVETLTLGQCFAANDRSFSSLKSVALEDNLATSDARGMARDILRLLGDKEKRSERGAAGTRFAKKHYGSGQYSGALSKFLFEKTTQLPEQKFVPHAEYRAEFESERSKVFELF